MDKMGEKKEYNDLILKKGVIEERIEKKELYNEKNKIVPTDTGKSINQFLISNFKDIVNIGFTSDMGSDLDKIAEGDKTYDHLIKPFYQFIIDKCKVEKRTKIMLENKQHIFVINNKDVIVRMARFGPIIEIPSTPKSIYIPL